MRTKFSVGDDVMFDGTVYIISAIQAYWFGVDELISYKLQGITGWVYEDKLEAVI